LVGAFAGNVQVFLTPNTFGDFPALGWANSNDDSIELYFDEGLAIPISVLIIVG
jgi:hypothetical protein